VAVHVPTRVCVPMWGVVNTQRQMQFQLWHDVGFEELAGSNRALQRHETKSCHPPSQRTALVRRLCWLVGSP